MSLPATELARIVALGAPILCLDTCSVLDVMRDPTRESVRAHDAQAAVDLLLAAETKTKLIALWAEQANFEFHDNLQSVEDDATKGVKKLQEQVKRVDAVAAVFGATGSASTHHLASHVTRARAVVDRWIHAVAAVPQGGHVASLALARVNRAITPARKGKDSAKDCVVIETYLEAVGALRAAGALMPIVFASSNVNDYCDAARVLKPDIAREFAALNLEFAPNLGAAKHLLGI